MTERIIPNLVGILGQNDHRRLLLAYPGVDLQVPKSVEAEHPLARAIGIEAATKLAAYAGGERLYIPSFLARAQRDLSIAAARLAGDQVEDIARRHGLTARTIKRILSRDGT